MGQRHQIYAVLPYTFKQEKEFYWNGDKEKEYVDSNIVALHHQWLYGTLPLRQLKQVLEFNKNGSESKYHVFNEGGQYTSGSPEDALRSLYSLDLETGGYHSVTIEPNLLAIDPRHGDNNDGITIIDFRNEGKPKYAFMFFDDYEGERKVYIPLSAEEYVRSYYNDEYYESRNEMSQESKDEWEKEIVKLLSFFDNQTVLNLSEVKEIFPSMFKEMQYEEQA